MPGTYYRTVAEPPAGSRVAGSRSATQVQWLLRGVAVLYAPEEIDASTLTEMQKAIETAMAEDLRHLVIHGANVRYVSSEGLGVLVGTRILLVERDGTLRIAAPSRIFHRILSDTRLDTLEEIGSMLAERVKDWTRQWRAEGWQDGQRAGEATALLCLLEQRFGPLDESMRRRIAEADAESLLRWIGRVLTAERLDDVLK